LAPNFKNRESPLRGKGNSRKLLGKAVTNSRRLGANEARPREDEEGQKNPSSQKRETRVGKVGGFLALRRVIGKSKEAEMLNLKHMGLRGRLLG